MNNNKSKILIVDDEPVNRLILARSFLEDEYAIFESSSGYEALTFIDHEVPDIILLDIMMPGMDGFQVCEEIKTIQRPSMCQYCLLLL